MKLIYRTYLNTIFVLIGVLFSTPILLYAQTSYVEYNGRMYPAQSSTDYRYKSITIIPVDEEKYSREKGTFTATNPETGETFQCSYFANSPTSIEIRDSYESYLTDENLNRFSMKKEALKNRIDFLRQALLLLDNMEELNNKIPTGEVELALFQTFSYEISRFTTDSHTHAKVWKQHQKGKFGKGFLPCVPAMRTFILNEDEALRRMDTTDMCNFLRESFPKRSIKNSSTRNGNDSEMCFHPTRKTVRITVKNPYLLPAIEVPNPAYRGEAYAQWGWLYENRGEMEEITTHYPVDEKYYVHPDHPSIKVYRNDYRGLSYAFQDGKLVCIMGYGNENDEVANAIYRQCYLNNKYDIHKENAYVQRILKILIGLSTNENMDWGFIASPSTHPMEMARICQRLGLNVKAIFAAKSKATDYLEQLKEDYRSQLEGMSSVMTDPFSHVFTSKDKKVQVKTTYSMTGKGQINLRGEVIRME